MSKCLLEDQGGSGVGGRGWSSYETEFCPQFSGGNPLENHELGVGSGHIQESQDETTCFRCSRGESLRRELGELTIKTFFPLRKSMVVSNQRQALCQRRAGGSWVPVGQPSVLPTPFPLLYMMRPKPATGASQDQPLPPPPHTLLS